MRGSPPKVAPLGLSHCLPASVFGPLVPSALRRLASIGWTRRACVTLLAVASGTERCRAQKTKPGEPQDRSRLVRAGDAPAALPALPAPAGLPLLDVDTQFMAELDLAPLLSTLHKPPESNGGWYGLRERLAHLGLAQSFDALLCLPHLRGIESFWYQIETVPASVARSPWARRRLARPVWCAGDERFVERTRGEAHSCRSGAERCRTRRWTFMCRCNASRC